MGGEDEHFRFVVVEDPGMRDLFVFRLIFQEFNMSSSKILKPVGLSGLLSYLQALPNHGLCLNAPKELVLIRLLPKRRPVIFRLLPPNRSTITLQLIIGCHLCLGSNPISKRFFFALAY